MVTPKDLLDSDSQEMPYVPLALYGYGTAGLLGRILPLLLGDSRQCREVRGVEFLTPSRDIMGPPGARFHDSQLHPSQTRLRVYSGLNDRVALS